MKLSHHFTSNHYLVLTNILITVRCCQVHFLFDNMGIKARMIGPPLSATTRIVSIVISKVHASSSSSSTLGTHSSIQQHRLKSI